EERQGEAEKLGRYRRTLRSCDAATVTTEPLAAHARAHVQQVDVVFNAVSEKMVRLSDEALGAREPGVREEVRVAYLSGTRTHNRDFLEAADALLEALERHEHARLVLVGKIDVDRRFERVA